MSNKQQFSENKTAFCSPLVQASSKMQLPFNNLLLLLSKRHHKKQITTRSVISFATPIHKWPQHASKTKRSSQGGQQDFCIVNRHIQRKSLIKPQRHSSSKDINSLYEKDIAKNKSATLKRQFQNAFRGMIRKKQILAKDNTHATQQLWYSTKFRDGQFNDNFKINLQNNQRSSKVIGVDLIKEEITRQKDVKAQTENLFYNSRNRNSKVKNNTHLFPRAKGQALKIKIIKPEVDFREENLKKCIQLHTGDLQPWMEQNKRLKTDAADGRSGDISEWFNKIISK